MAQQIKQIRGAAAISFIDHLKSSENFKLLFREGMAMVEEAAAYLDGPGREESKGLPRAPALAYATESMRLTTRLMQMASWLLLQRAVNEGEMSQSQAAADKHKVRMTRQDMAAPAEVYAQLPDRLRVLSEKSLRLQARIIHLDRSIYRSLEQPEAAAVVTVAEQMDRLRAAFGAV